MTTTRTPDLRLVIGLACLTLLYPILGVLTQLLAGDAPAARALWAPGLWLLIAISWILVVWLTRAPRPLLTLVLTGVAGGLVILIVGAIAQLATAGTVGLLGSPWGIVGLLVMQALGGTVCGLIAWGLQAATGRTPRA